jgi:hypothetical protein
LTPVCAQQRPMLIDEFLPKLEDGWTVHARKSAPTWRTNGCPRSLRRLAANHAARGGRGEDGVAGWPAPGASAVGAGAGNVVSV